MAEQKLVAATQTDGRLVWFPAACAKSWPPSQLEDGRLFFRNGSWVLMPAFEDALGGTGKVVSDEQALSWFCRNNVPLPEELQVFAESRRL